MILLASSTFCRGFRLCFLLAFCTDFVCEFSCGFVFRVVNVGYGSESGHVSVSILPLAIFSLNFALILFASSVVI